MTKSEILNPNKKHKQNFPKLKRKFVRKSDPIKKLLENHKNNVEESKEIGLLKRKNYIKFFNGGLINLSKEQRNIVYSLLSKDIAVLATMLLLHKNAEAGRVTMERISNCLEGVVSEDAVRTSILKLDRLGLIKKGKARYIKAKNKRSTIVYKFPIWTKYFSYTKRKYGCSIYDLTMDSLVTEQPRNLSGNKININNDTSKAGHLNGVVDPSTISFKPKMEEFTPYFDDPIILTDKELNFASIPKHKFRKIRKRKPRIIKFPFMELNKHTGKLKNLVDNKEYPTIISGRFNKKRKRNGTILEVLKENSQGGYDIRRQIELDDILYTRHDMRWCEKNGIRFKHDQYRNPILRQTITKDEYLKAKRDRFYEKNNRAVFLRHL